MGWKGTLRSVNAASNRAQRESAKNERSLNRDLGKVDREIEQVRRKCQSLEVKLEKDIVKALGIRYTANSGFTSTPFQIQTSLFSGSIDLLCSEKDYSDDFHFQPEGYELESVHLEALDILVTQWATLVAFRIQHKEQDFHLRLNWVKKSDPSDSKVYLLDPVNSEYYYPISTDLKGEVLSGHPRAGIIAFEPFRHPTTSVQIYFSDVQLLPKIKLDPFCFESTKDEKFQSGIQEIINKPSLTNQIEKTLQEQENKLKTQIQAAHSSGCLIFFILGAGITLAILLMTITV
jgi:hypothetical protein